MGLDLFVGILDAIDPADRQATVDEITHLSTNLRAAGLAEHVEPTDHPDGVWEAQMWGYSGLHNLRRLAAHLREGRDPKPLRTGADAAKDRLLAAMYKGVDWTVGDDGVALYEFPTRQGPSFDHLVLHMDNEGFYVPQRFRGVLMTWSEGDPYTQMVGSSQMLIEECERLAEWLELDLGMDHESEELWEAADEPGGRDAPKWKRFGIESFSCLRLHRAASESVRTERLLVFG